MLLSFIGALSLEWTVCVSDFETHWTVEGGRKVNKKKSFPTMPRNAEVYEIGAAGKVRRNFMFRKKRA